MLGQAGANDALERVFRRKRAVRAHRTHRFQKFTAFHHRHRLTLRFSGRAVTTVVLSRRFGHPLRHRAGASSRKRRPRLRLHSRARLRARLRARASSFRRRRRHLHPQRTVRLLLPFLLAHVHHRGIRRVEVPRGDAPIIAPDALKSRRRVQGVSDLTLPVFIRRDQPRSTPVLARDASGALTN